MLRICLSLHAKPYDPLSLILPVKMVGSLLFRNTLQELKRLHVGKIPWDEEIVSEELKKSWFDYFEMLLGLDQIKFNHVSNQSVQ